MADAIALKFLAAPLLAKEQRGEFFQYQLSPTL